MYDLSNQVLYFKFQFLCENGNKWPPLSWDTLLRTTYCLWKLLSIPEVYPYSEMDSRYYKMCLGPGVFERINTGLKNWLSLQCIFYCLAQTNGVSQDCLGLGVFERISTGLQNWQPYLQCISRAWPRLMVYYKVFALVLVSLPRINTGLINWLPLHCIFRAWPRLIT